MLYPHSQKDMMDALQTMEAYAHTHEVCMELDGRRDPQTQAEVWAVQAWTAEEFDGEPMQLLSYIETKSDTPMEAVQKAIAMLDAPIPDPPIIDDIPPEEICECGAGLDENGECPYCDSPGLPFARYAPEWDQIYGTSRDENGHPGHVIKCPVCNGFGSLDHGGYVDPCPNCSGSGEVWIGVEDVV